MMTIHEDQIFDEFSELPAGDFDGCTFTNCRFAGQNFSERTFSDCRFSDCDLSNVKLAETSMKAVWFANCKLIGLHFDDCGAFLFEVHFKGCQLELSTFRERDLRRSSFENCILPETDFKGADLRKIVFSNCDLSRSIFERCDLREADFRTSRNYEISPDENRLRKARFSLDGLPGLLTDYGIIVE